MSGIIDDAGRQWEHCNVCTRFVLINNLGYLPPNKAHKHGQDICISCVNELPQKDIKRVIPAANWKKQLK